MITSRSEGNIEKQTKFKISSHSIVDRLTSPSPCLCSGGPLPVRSGWQHRDFISNRKYQYHPNTQADVGDCLPCKKPISLHHVVHVYRSSIFRRVRFYGRPGQRRSEQEGISSWSHERHAELHCWFLTISSSKFCFWQLRVSFFFFFYQAPWDSPRIFWHGVFFAVAWFYFLFIFAMYIEQSLENLWISFFFSSRSFIKPILGWNARQYQ